MTYLIIPCFNEEQRLQLDSFSKFANDKLYILFADDGSSDNTASKILSYTQKHPHMGLYKAPQNMGKGEVIRHAYEYIKKSLPTSSDTWFGYWDADLATPLYEVENMKKYNAALYDSKAVAIYASRVYRLGSRIIRSAHRHYLGRAFATFISIMLKIESYDSQCGAKLFTSEAAQKAFAEPFISRWIFDVEIMLRLQNENLIEYPLKYWEDIPGSKVKIFKELLRIYRDVMKIKAKYRR